MAQRNSRAPRLWRIALRTQAHRKALILAAWWMLSAAAVADAVPGSTAWVPFELRGDALLVASRMAGVAGRTRIDPTATITAINSRFVARHDLQYRTSRPMTIGGQFGKSKRRTFVDTEAQLLGANLRLAKVVEVDLGPPQVQLMVGASFFANWIVQIDYPNQRLRLLPRDALDVRAMANVRSRLHRRSGEMQVKLRLDDARDLWLDLSIGSSAGLWVQRPRARRWGWLEAYPARHAMGGGLVAGGPIEVLTLPRVEVGPYQVEQVEAVVPGEGVPVMRLASEAPGLVGAGLLRSWVVTLDYRSGAVHLGMPGEP